MIENIELQIIQDTLTFLNEECIGPQRSYLVFKKLKNKYENRTAFSYSYFISLFDNHEIISKQIVKEAIEKYNAKSNFELNGQQAEAKKENINTNNVEKEESESTNKVEEKVILYNPAIKEKYSEDYYYYCTKIQKVLKPKIIQALLKLFEDKHTERLDFLECYEYLKHYFNINSFNRAKLSQFLNSDKIVLKSYIEDLKTKYPYKQTEISLMDLKGILVNNRFKFIKIIECLGLEYVKYIIKNGLKSTVNFFNAFIDFSGKNQEYLRFKDNNNTNLFDKSNADMFFNFLNLFNSDEEIIEVFKDFDGLKELIDMFFEDEKKNLQISNFVKESNKLFELIHQDNLNSNIKYIFPFDMAPLIGTLGITKLSELKTIGNEKIKSLYQYKDTFINLLKILQRSLPHYLNERFKLILQRVNVSNVPNSLWQKYVEIMIYRESGLNLEETSKYFDTSRERIRQIELKYLNLFNNFYSSESGTITRLLRAFSRNEAYLTRNDIEAIFSFYPQLFWYMLKKIDIVDLNYIDELDIFYYIDEYDWYNELLSKANSLKDCISKDEMDNYIELCYHTIKDRGVNIPFDYCKTIILQEFKLNGTIYSKSKINLLSRYRQILQSSFPDGINIYEAEDIKKFRDEYKKIFNDNRIPDNDRALYSRITAICILVDKGKWALQKDKYISDELAIKIHDYIINNNQEILLTNQLYTVFENELKEQGINNKYYLQGIIKSLFSDEFYFSRDYISKTKEKSSIYNEIIEYMRNAEGEVSLKKIKEDFIGVPDNVLLNSLNSDQIISFSGSYIHVDNFKIDENDIPIFKQLVEKMLKDMSISSTYAAYEYLENMNNPLIKKYNINTQFKLFSILQHFLQADYEFQRPYFAHKGIKIERYSERIINFIKEHNEVTMSELKNEFPIVSDAMLYNNLSSDEILCFRQTYIHVDNFNILKEDIDNIERIMKDLCGDNSIHNSYELLMILEIKNRKMVERLNINSQAKLFAIIQHYLKDKFEFQRPNFANKGIEILGKRDRIVDYLREFDEIKISDLFDWIYKNQLGLESIVGLVDEMKDEYVFKDKETIISLEKSKITKYNTELAEQVLLSAMKDECFILSSKFNGYKFLTKDVKWTDWLLYSAINKFGKDLKAITSASQMRYSEPIYLLKSIPANNVEELKSYIKGKTKMNDIEFIKYLKRKGLID